MATPFLKPIRVQGGTFFTFASAAKDISKTFTDDNARFVFSKYALLDIPKVKVPANGLNNVVWQASNALSNTGAAAPLLDDFVTDNNFNFSQSFQSYALNFEQLILASQNTQGTTYDETVLSTVSERVFWHWLKNINVIRWADANTTNQSNVASRYVEGNTTGATYQYEQVTKYLGDIEIINNISKGGQSYSEIYIHVPTSHGNTPLVLYKTEEDVNFAGNMKWQGDSSGKLFGRENNGNSTPFGLFNDAFYDNFTTDQYVLGATFGLATTTSATAFYGPSPGTPQQVLISNLDGVKIDFDPASYFPITNDPQLSTLDDFNASAMSGDFTFNVCLLYYDTYDVSNPDNFARNLYGVLVIDDYENGVIESDLKHFTKFKPNAVTKLNGNSYGLKLNLKFDTENDNVGVETVIREDLTFGMDLFADASVRLQESADMFIDQKLELINLSNKVSSLEQYYFSQTTLEQLQSRLDTLESGLNNAELNFADETTLLDLIRENSDNINDILTGEVNVQLTYNTDVIQPGPGINIDNSVPNQISVGLKNQGYYYFSTCLNDSGHLMYDVDNGMTAGASANGNRLLLGEFTNYYRNIGATGATVLDNININIDDTNYKWKTGQTMRIVFENDINLDTYTINLNTDAQNTQGNGAYNTLIGSLTIADLVTTKPIIEVICVNAATYSFYVDVVK